MKNCYRLNIDISNALKENLISKRFNKFLVENFTYNFENIFNKEWFDELTEKVGPIKNVLIFSRPAYWSTRVSHVDLKNNKTPVWFSLNWVLLGKDSEMVWHEPPKDYLNSSNIETTMSNNYNLQWEVNDLKVIERFKVVNEMVIARTDIPHSIIVKSQPRIAIAIRPSMSIDSRSSWRDAIEFYKRKSLLIEN
jgi:hypothetical protein